MNIYLDNRESGREARINALGELDTLFGGVSVSHRNPHKKDGGYIHISPPPHHANREVAFTKDSGGVHNAFGR